MNNVRQFFHASLCLLTALLLLVADPVQAGGNFRFLTTGVPDGTTNGEYFAKIFTANATGKVQFSLKTGCGAQCGTLPTGLVLNSLTGTISGKPTVVETKNVTIIAEDDVGQIELYLDKFKVSAAGGGGNSGASFATTVLPDGRVGEPWTLTLQSQGGTGPFIWGAQDLPAGITLDGTTGVVSGVPTVAGTFYVTFTNNDTGEGNTVITTLPLTVYPTDTVNPPVYVFRFDTYMLNNGEVGTPYSDTLFISDEDGAVTFSATGLPPGLVLDPATGIVAGTPQVAGTFYLTLSATDGGTGKTITTNLPMWIAPSATSNFYWNYFGLPAALYGEAYNSSFPIVVNAINGSSVTYDAQGLPPGISYNPTTGELSGTPSEVGVFPVIYNAIDSSNGDTLTLSTDFIVLPPGGGDVSRLAVNLWIKKLSVKVNADAASAPNDSWQAQYIYNADRRTGTIFNLLADAMFFSLASSEKTVLKDSGAINSKSGVFTYKSLKGSQPLLDIKGTPSSQSLIVKFSATETGIAAFPVDLLDNVVRLGNKGYKLKVALDSKGKFSPATSPRNASFVVASAKVKDVGSSKDSAQISMYLADPSLLTDFAFAVCDKKVDPNCNQPHVSIRLYDGIKVLLDKDLTALLAATRTEDKTGVPFYKMKKVVKTDPAAENSLSTFSFDSKTGLLKVGVKNLVLASSLSPSQAHVGVELKMGNMSYFTAITLFESGSGSNSYSSTISKYATPFLQ